MKRPARLEAAFLLLLFFLLLVRMMGGPLIGLADSGDYTRLMGWGALAYSPEWPARYFAYLPTHFAIVGSPWLAHGDYFSSEALFIKLASGLAVLAGRHDLDIRLLGIVHLVAFILALGCLTRGFRMLTGHSGLLLAPMLVVVFGDVGYFSYFQSLYSEPADLIFLIAMLGAALGLARPAGPRRRDLALWLGFALLLLAAKTQNAGLAPLLVVFTGFLGYQGSFRRHRPLLVAGALGFLLLAGLQLRLNPPYMTAANHYASVFNGVLKRSHDPAHDLRELGLSPALAPLARSTFFSPDLPYDLHGTWLRRAFFQRITPVHVLLYYVTHPARALLELRAASNGAFRLRQDYLGNCPIESGRPPMVHIEAFEAWSDFKCEDLPASFSFVAPFWALLLWLTRPRPGAGPREALGRAIGCLAVAMAAQSMVLPIVGDGESDLGKHLFMFNALFDLALVFLSAGLIAAAIAGGQALVAKLARYARLPKQA